MHLESEGGEERSQSQHETTDHRCKPRIAATTRADDQRRWATGNRGAQRPSPHWNTFIRYHFRRLLERDCKIQGARLSINIRIPITQPSRFGESGNGAFHSGSPALTDDRRAGESSFADWFAPYANEERTQNRFSLGFRRYILGFGETGENNFTCFSFPSIFAFGPGNRARPNSNPFNAGKRRRNKYIRARAFYTTFYATCIWNCETFKRNSIPLSKRLFFIFKTINFLFELVFFNYQIFLGDRIAFLLSSSKYVKTKNVQGLDLLPTILFHNHRRTCCLILRVCCLDIFCARSNARYTVRLFFHFSHRVSRFCQSEPSVCDIIAQLLVITLRGASDFTIYGKIFVTWTTLVFFDARWIVNCYLQVWQ